MKGQEDFLYNSLYKTFNSYNEDQMFKNLQDNTISISYFPL